MEVETGMATPNSKDGDPETEIDGREETAFRGQNPKEDIEIIEITAEIGEGMAVKTGEIRLLGYTKETMRIEIEKEERTEMEEKERAQIEKTGIEVEKEEKMKK